MHLERNIELLSCNHFCSGEAMSVTYSESAFVTSGTQHALPMLHIVICGLPSSTTIFPHYLINGTIFEKKKESYLTQNVCFDFLYNFCLKLFSL